MNAGASVIIDCTGVGSESEFWEAYVQDAKPQGAEFFGRNLDAFWDALHGGPGFPQVDEVRFTGTSSLATLRNGDFLKALREIAHTSAGVKITLER